jgi:hypothetical protein
MERDCVVAGAVWVVMWMEVVLGRGSVGVRMALNGGCGGEVLWERGGFALLWCRSLLVRIPPECLVDENLRESG